MESLLQGGRGDGWIPGAAGRGIRERPGGFVARAALRFAVAALAFLLPAVAFGAMEEVRFDAACDLSRLRRVVIGKVFRDGANTVRAWDDETGCNHLTLSDPEVRPGASSEQVVVRMRAEGRKSWKVGAWCSFPLDWTGSFALGLEPRVDRDSGRLVFEVRSATAEDASGRAQPVEGALREWLRDRVEPRFADLRLAPGDLLPGLDRILPEVAPGPIDDAEVARRMVESIGFDRVALSGDDLALGVAFQVDAVPPAGQFAGMDGQAREAASAEALRRLDGFTSFVVESTADETSSVAARDALFGVLLEERHAMVAELAAGVPADPNVPAREVFAATWPGLSREVRRAAADVPSDARDRYAAFLAAGAAVRAIADLGANSPLDLGPDGLRALARLLAPETDRDPLATDDQVDPRLRTLFGFGPPLERTAAIAAVPEATPVASATSDGETGSAAPPPGESSPEPTPPATPTPIPDPLSRLARWVPTSADAGPYLATVRDGLARAVTEAARGPAGRSSLGPIVEAIAWQASCWRFWVVRGEQVVPLVAPSGGVGWLGVDPRTWRGFFDPQLLRSDPGYGARAGAEIVVRLASPALRSTGDGPAVAAASPVDAAAREAAEIHALHDGGPSELRRLREGRASAAEVERSRGFREKLARLRAGEIPSVAECFAAEVAPVPSAAPAASSGDASEPVPTPATDTVEAPTPDGPTDDGSGADGP